MSQRTDASPTPPNPLPKVDENPLRSGSWRSSRGLESNDKPDRQRSLRMSEGRESGELEGSTLGSSSRDGDKGGRGSRRTRSSGGFLLDSSFLPRSSSLRHSYHRAHHSESERKEKRGTPPDSEIVVPKKRSRFPWSRQKEPTKESSAALPEREASQETPGPSHSQQDAVPHPSQTAEVGSEAPLGLDRDSLQIVNLALNLSESRRVSAHGRVPSGRVAGGRWTASAGQPSVSLNERGAPIALGSQNDSPYPRRSFTQIPVDNRSNRLGASHMDQAVHAPSSVLNLLPDSANSNSLPHVFSDGTLARAEKARRHFELFSEYLRLLPSLPPLKPHEAHTDPDSTPAGAGDTPPGRSYNPLQSIRNRKVRFRERCPIDTDAEGWTNVGKVHEWVDSIESQYNQQDHSSFECLKLPPFHQGSKDLSHKEPEDDEIIAASPSSSLRRTSRASSVKARRPKSDWMISPPELLADIAWVEDIQNKSKLIDKDGNNLYPDAAMLIPSDALKPKTRNPQEELPSRRESVDTDQPTSHTSLSDAHPGLTPEFKRIGRGRRRHRFQGTSHIVRSSGGRHKLRRRSSSSSSASSRDDKQYWKYQGESMVSPRRSTSLRPEPSRAKGYVAPPDESSLDMKIRSPQSSSFQRSWKASDRTKSQEQRESISSAPSVDDRYDRLTTSVTADGRVPLTPIQPTFFPSIASNLSPPSSRSPSPSKGRFPRAIIPRRERSKSNSRPKDAVDNSSPESEVLRSNSLSEYSEGLPRIGRLDPSPLLDQTPSTHQDGRIRSSQQARKGLTQHESKLRGIFKGPGKIAEKVGNEVSKMGGLILKKDSLAHSRQSSFESHVTSDDETVLTDAEESKGDKTTNIKASLRRLPTFSEDYSLAARRESEKATGKNYLSAPLPFTSPTRQGDQPEGHRRSDLGSPQKTSSESEMKSARETGSRDEALSTSQQKRPDVRKKPGKVPTFGPELHTIREQIKKGRIKDPSVPYSLTRPPITGLAQAKASHEPSSHERRSTPSSQSRSWSISERSVSTSTESGVPAKREVERTRALLLSSGIKAREITRRAHTVRNPPPEFLRRAFGSDTPVPEVPRSHEFNLAIQALVKRFEKSEELFQRSMDGYPGAKLSSLSSHLGALEDLVNNSLNPRVRAAAQDAEDLSIQLNTTSTLAVKQLSDTLDKGIRRRHRRLRWIRRTGFVMLEWALVGILWWVWLIVMAFKLLRGVFQGVISGVRWVLWL
ncbi:hypothetical protein ABOM_003682 [Aspergillus bombycis]|uniref:Uncharacterized protein n=1 Tax=Aspergillus bombycis TaxID=109264 RepID=A0A1F8A611_9EURO|nr:hypothetical protein ABOM_003682 [Aspergillus bombycis]OGM47123.1 hypothetical protein ABOM_003682 [Aspergillus bombycis]